MSSTSNAQDLLVNVFRPTYRWDSNTGFVPSLVVSNVTELIAGSVKADRLAVTDLNLNTYIGCNAGGGAVGTASNVALGYNAMGGAVNSSNNVAVGMFSLEGLSNSDCNVALGARTDITGRGARNVLIGPNVTMGDGSGNIFIGVDISAGNVSKRFQLGSLLYGDLSSGFVGINTSAPTAALDISGIVVFRNKVGFQNPDPTYSLDVAGSVYASEQFIGSNGTSSKPLFTFKDASGSGMYVPESNLGYGVGAFAIAVNQSPAAVFSSNAVNFFQNLDVSGTFSARNIDISAFSVTDGTQTTPAVTFTSDTSTGLYLVSSNRLGVTTGGLRRMEVLSNGDISFGHLVTRDISYSGTIVGSDPTTCNVIGGVVLCNGYVTTTGTSSSSNLVITGFIRNSDPATQLDLSGGNISNSGTTRSANFLAVPGGAPRPGYAFTTDPSSGMDLVTAGSLAFETGGVQRMCISGGFVGIGTLRPVVALDVSGDISANVYNGPGGTQTAPHYTFSDDRTTGLFFPGANMIGLTAGGVERMRFSNSNVGIGTTAPSNALDVSGTLRIIGPNGNITFSNGTIDISGTQIYTPTGAFINGVTTSNRIGGVTLNNFDLCMSSTGRILAPILRNALTPTTYDISGGNISNSLTTRSSNFIGTTTASNSIGGVTLSNSNISYAGTIAGTTASASNQIGGVTLSNTNISYAGTIIGSTANTSNQIGGVTLSNTNISYAGTIIGSTANTSNQIGGVTLSNTNISYAGTITGSTANTSNRIGGVLLSNSNVQITDGTVGAPSLAFLGDTATGFYRPSTNSLHASVAGVRVLGMGPNLIEFSNGGLASLYIFSNQLQAQNGSVGAPTYSFINDTSMGFYRIGSGHLGFATAGITRMTFSNANVGIGLGTTAPAYALDVCGVGHFRTAGSNSGQIELGDPAGTLVIQRDQAGNGYLRPQSDATMYLGASNSNTVNIRPNAVGINLAGAPGYALDIISTATTAAAINTSTWPRYGVSTTHMVKTRSGTGSTATLSALFASPAISLNAQLGTVTNDTVNGTYFVCKRSGVWTITTGLHGNSSTPSLMIDVSNNITYNDAINVNAKRALATTIGGHFYANLSFTGYLPSNDNLYYKIRCTGFGIDTDAAYLYITFHNELPAATGFPYV